MSIQNLNSIEGVMDEVLNLVKDQEEMSIVEWSPILQPWCNTLTEACKELKLFRPFTGKEFKLLKLGLVKEWMGLLEQIQGEVECESITDAYEEVESKIDSNVMLAKHDILIILYFGLSILIERSESDDYSEFYDLVAIEDAIEQNNKSTLDIIKPEIINDNKGKVNSAQTEKTEINESSVISEFVWAILIMMDGEMIKSYDEEKIKKEFPTLKYERFNSLIREYRKAKKMKEILDSTEDGNYNRQLLAKITTAMRTKCEKSLKFAIKHYENINQVAYNSANEYSESLAHYPDEI